MAWSSAEDHSTWAIMLGGCTNAGSGASEQAPEVTVMTSPPVILFMASPAETCMSSAAFREEGMVRATSSLSLSH